MSAEGSELESKSVMRPREINVTFVSMLSDFHKLSEAKNKRRSPKRMQSP